MTMLRRPLSLTVLALLASGCVSLKHTPEARFFVLRSVEAPSTQPTPPREAAVGVEAVRLPGHLERPQVVTEAGGNELRIDEFVRWAEPLGPALTRILAENLAAQLPERLVLESPWPARTKLLCRVMVEVEAFAPDTKGTVRLDGRWALLGDRGDARPLSLRRFALRGGPVPVDATGLVDADAGAEAMSQLLGQLSKQIADDIRQLPEPVKEEVLHSEPAPGP